jgi:hypothetical protein
MATAVGTPVQSYFANLLNNHSEREAFQNKVLDPLLTALNALNANRDVVYGLDLINEIEAPLNAGYFPFLAGSQRLYPRYGRICKKEKSLVAGNLVGRVR